MSRHRVARARAGRRGRPASEEKGAFIAEESTFDRIVKILQEQDGLEDVEITNDTKLSDLGLDSLSVVEAVMACEDEFGIEVDADAAPETVGDFVDMVEALNE